ncbi:MAG: sigma-54 dependent transcriptional regulator [Acidobacteria bacterium]|nr:sigma-54 dependent transcriptional regulator [Acidobacteriota bacterium]
MTSPARELLHGALDSVAGAPLGEARLTDRQRLAVLLQGVAVLGHLARAGRMLSAGWHGAVVTPDGRLGGFSLDVGVDRALPQRRAVELMRELFRAGSTIAGRGEARRVARELMEVWRQDLEPVSADQLVGQVLTAAPFLWQEAFGEARVALAAAIGAPDPELWVVGPSRFRRRLLRACDDLAALQSLLAVPEVTRLWGTALVQRDPVELAREGRWRRAVEVWVEHPPGDSDSQFEMARALYAIGRFAAAKRALHGLRRTAARILRLGCQLRIGELAAAKRALKRWADRMPAGEHRLDLAAVAVRVFASRGEPEAALWWVDQALECTEPEQRLHAMILAGEAAWDRRDHATVERQIEATVAADELERLAWRRSHLQALLAMARGEGRSVVEHMRRALGSRRLIRPFEAVGLWNDLAVGRSMVGDLAGAERALRHVVRLTSDSEGDRRTTLALCNLAEIRLRRGELKGVHDVLERSAKANAKVGNWRGWAQDQELAVRYELVRGRPGAALERVESALERLAQRDLDWRRGRLGVLAARAHGWLGDVSAARAALATTSAEDRAELEPEERAPLWAQAGELENALEENPPGPCQRLWQQLLTAEENVDWSPLRQLEPYRAARLIFDAELLGPGRAPKDWVRRAAATLRSVGASALAERLDAGDEGPWRAVERYLESVDGSVADRLTRLLAEVSPEARLTWRDADSEVEIVAGPGGHSVLERALHGGALRLAAVQLGSHERVAFALALRDLPVQRVDARPVSRKRHGMIGESAALLSALDRLSKLAQRDLPILIQGETGTGKEPAARLVHAHSHRSEGPFLPVNCAALAGDLVLSELFGHVRGAFTGADRDRAGIFEAARGGTVLLDEVGDLPLLAQGKLLRVLQEGEVRRVGESVARSVDVRVIAATHRDLSTMVADGDFRQDFLYRLKVGYVELPPLRDRGQDLVLLSEHFLASEGGGVTPALSNAARALLAGYSWPGNVRELKNVLTVGMALAEGGRIDLEHLDLPREIRVPRSGYHEQVEAFRRRLVQEAVAAAGGNRAAAARSLGLSRQALSYLVRQLDID